MKKILLLPVLIFYLATCITSPETHSSNAVSVSILPQKYFVESIAGDKLKVNVMIPPGASHSSYEPTPKQMNLLVSSQAYLKIGPLDFELAWMPRFSGANPEMKIFDLSEGIDLIKGSHDHHEGEEKLFHPENETGIDPHIWLSPVNVKIMSFNILKALISIYPSDSVEFTSNYNSFMIQVDSVASLYNSNANNLKGKSFIIYHPALAYMARDFGMQQIVLEFEGKEPHPVHIKEIIDLAKEKNIHSIFVQKQFSIDNSRSLAKEINAEIITIDPMEENWKEQMISILGHLLSDKTVPEVKP